MRMIVQLSSCRKFACARRDRRSLNYTKRSHSAARCAVLQLGELRSPKLVRTTSLSRYRYCFASTTSFTETAPQLRKSLEKELSVPLFLFERLYRQSNGFAGHIVELDREQNVETYTHWSRFVVKQTYNNLMPKRTFTLHMSLGRI
ncbi:hypothetical protein IQ07DRAFT_162344 [Pyrenochaeta sp. DS3sAY3a]|nr:hypothetical protein IQ07DRAFT_162344 [Pyrenochaeta sp. DS3sAY3a]